MILVVLMLIPGSSIPVFFDSVVIHWVRVNFAFRDCVRDHGYRQIKMQCFLVFEMPERQTQSHDNIIQWYLYIVFPSLISSRHW